MLPPTSLIKSESDSYTQYINTECYLCSILWHFLSSMHVRLICCLIWWRIVPCWIYIILDINSNICWGIWLINNSSLQWYELITFFLFKPSSICWRNWQTAPKPKDRHSFCGTRSNWQYVIFPVRKTCWEHKNGIRNQNPSSTPLFVAFLCQRQWALRNEDHTTIWSLQISI